MFQREPDARCPGRYCPEHLCDCGPAGAMRLPKGSTIRITVQLAGHSRRRAVTSARACRLASRRLFHIRDTFHCRKYNGVQSRRNSSHEGQHTNFGGVLRITKVLPLMPGHEPLWRRAQHLGQRFNLLLLRSRATSLILGNRPVAEAKRPADLSNSKAQGIPSLADPSAYLLGHVAAWAPTMQMRVVHARFSPGRLGP